MNAPQRKRSNSIDPKHFNKALPIDVYKTNEFEHVYRFIDGMAKNQRLEQEVKPEPQIEEEKQGHGKVMKLTVMITRSFEVPEVNPVDTSQAYLREPPYAFGYGETKMKIERQVTGVV